MLQGGVRACLVHTVCKLGLGEMPRLNAQFHAARIGEVGVAVIVNSKNRLKSLSLEQLSDLYDGRHSLTWDHLDAGLPGKSVHLFSPLLASMHSLIVRTVALGVYTSFAPSLQDYTRPDCGQKMSVGEVIEGVAGDAGGIGYVPYPTGELDRRVRVIAVRNDGPNQTSCTCPRWKRSAKTPTC